MMLLNIIFNLFFVSVVWAQSCPTTNLLTEPNSPFNKIPVYNQDGSGTCYAFTASQLANYYLMKEKNYKDLEYHPLWAALTYAQDNKSDSVVGGVADGALEALANSKNCSYQSVTKSLQRMAKDNKMTDHEILGFIETFASEYGKLWKKFHEEIAKESEEEKRRRKEESYYKAKIDNTYVKKPVLPHTIKSNRIYLMKTQALESTVNIMKGYTTCSEDTLREFSKIISPILGAMDTKIIQKLLFTECKTPNRTNPLPQPSIYLPKKATDSDFSKMIRNHFSKTDQPLGIRYCSNFLTDPTLESVGNNPNLPRYNDRGKSCGSHASILVGSRLKGKSCQYLLRNTWGAGYSSWTNNWSCACRNKKTGKYFENCTKKTHPVSQYEVSGCWIPESKLIKNMYGAQWLE